MKLGRRCPRASPYNVNCETTSAAPSTSSRDRFIFPWSSSKMRKLATFSAMDAATAGVSSRPTPSSTNNPAPISPVMRPSTVTLARLTLCTTARISPVRLRLVFRGLTRQQVRKLRHVVGKHRQHLRTFGQIIPAHVLERIRLRVMHLVVVGYVLHAPESRHARVIKGHVVRAALAAQARLRQSDFFDLGERIQRM